MSIPRFDTQCRGGEWDEFVPAKDGDYCRYADVEPLEKALKKCLLVLADLDLNKTALIDALKAGRNALGEEP
jgi:hypothetical protein